MATKALPASVLIARLLFHARRMIEQVERAQLRQPDLLMGRKNHQPPLTGVMLKLLLQIRDPSLVDCGKGFIENPKRCPGQVQAGQSHPAQLTGR